MFETLEPPEQLVARRWPLFMYGTYSLAGFVFFVLGVRRYGFSQPFNLVIAAVMLVLSLVWFVTTLRSRSPLTSRRFGIHNIILLLLLIAHDIPSNYGTQGSTSVINECNRIIANWRLQPAEKRFGRRLLG